MSWFYHPWAADEAATPVFFGPKVTLAADLVDAPKHRGNQRAPYSRLRPPAVIGASKINPGLRIKLRDPNSLADRNRRRQPKSVLRPPRVVTAAATPIFFGPKVFLGDVPDRARHQVNQRQPYSRLRPPAVIAGSIAWHGPGIYLTRPRRGAPKSHLFAPPTTVVAGGIAWHGPGVYLTRPKQPPPVTSVLRAPVVVTQVVVQVYYGPAVTLAPSARRKGQALLFGPAVIGAARINPGLRIKLAFGQSRRGRSRLSPPAVVVVSAPGQFFGPAVSLARARPPRVFSRLYGPVLVNLPTAAYGPGRALVAPRSTRPKTLSQLAKPAVIEGIEGPQGGILISLSPSRRPGVKSLLKRPPVVAPAALAYPLSITLARIRPVRTSAFLEAPTDITEAGEFPVARVYLSYSRRGRPKSRLSLPTVVFPFFARRAEIALARIRPQRVHSRLAPPILPPLAEPTRVILASSRRPVSKSILGVPLAAADVYYGPSVELAPSSRGQTAPVLRGPVVVEEAVAVFYATRVTLAPSSRGQAKSALQPPAVIGAARINPGLRIKLVFGQTRPAYSRLSPPAVVQAVTDVFFGPKVELTFSRRPKAVYGLGHPAVISEAAEGPHGGVLVSLAPQRRGKPKSFLRAPQVLRRELARAILISLAPQARGKAKSLLKRPTVVRLAVEIFGPETWLTYSRRGRAKYLLKPPAVVGIRPHRGILVSLAPSFRGTPKPFRIPEIVGVEPFRPIQLHLTRITPPPVLSALSEPSVIGAGIAFYGPLTWLTRIKHPPVQYNLPVVLVAFRRPGGDVCGFDIAGSFVCYLEVPGSQVSGSDASTSQVTGSSQAGSKVTGTESPGGSVSGSDRKAT